MQLLAKSSLLAFKKEGQKLIKRKESVLIMRNDECFLSLVALDVATVEWPSLASMLMAKPEFIVIMAIDRL
jgi:hypothetical protein